MWCGRLVGAEPWPQPHSIALWELDLTNAVVAESLQPGHLASFQHLLKSLKPEEAITAAELMPMVSECSTSVPLFRCPHIVSWSLMHDGKVITANRKMESNEPLIIHTTHWPKMNRSILLQTLNYVQWRFRSVLPAELAQVLVSKISFKAKFIQRLSARFNQDASLEMHDNVSEPALPQFPVVVLIGPIVSGYYAQPNRSLSWTLKSSLSPTCAEPKVKYVFRVQYGSEPSVLTGFLPSWRD